MDPKLETNHVLCCRTRTMRSCRAPRSMGYPVLSVSRFPGFWQRRDGIVGRPWREEASSRLGRNGRAGDPMLIFPRRISQLPWSPHFLITLCTWSRPRGVVACRRAKLSALARPGVRVGPTVGYIVIWGFQTARRLSSPGGCRNVTGTLQQLNFTIASPFQHAPLLRRTRRTNAQELRLFQGSSVAVDARR